ncbi:MAG: PrsW family intramembrane metalloprotease [bacterium]|nr:PrsW family intramembrane metalloprotease [bacterium]
MSMTLFMTGIVGPAFLWNLYFYYKDRFKPEPKRYILMAFFLGVLAAFVCTKMYALAPLLGLPGDPSVIMESNRLLFFFYCLVPVGLFEEVTKFLPFLFIIYFLRSFDEPIDGIIYASVIALGFAAYENSFYLPYMEGFEFIGRAIATPLTHGIFSSIWGHAVGKARLEGKSVFKAAAGGLILSVFFHGVFDFFTTSVSLQIFASVVILGVWIWRIRVTERLHKEAVASAS